MMDPSSVAILVQWLQRFIVGSRTNHTRLGYSVLIGMREGLRTALGRGRGPRVDGATAEGGRGPLAQELVDSVPIRPERAVARTAGAIPYLTSAELRRHNGKASNEERAARRVARIEHPT